MFDKGRTHKFVFSNIISPPSQAVFKASREAQAATRTIYIPTFKTAISLSNAQHLFQQTHFQGAMITGMVRM
jgi:hypothetical protein